MKKKKPTKKQDEHWEHNCCQSAEVFLCKSMGEMKLDLNDGMFGISIVFCPWCGEKLK